VVFKHEPLDVDVSDMMQTFWRLITNPTLMCNNLASVFYFLGYMPYWVFMAKYIETQYRQSASTSSLITGELTAPLPPVFGLLHSKPHILQFTSTSSLITGELTAPPPLQVSALLHSKPQIWHFPVMSFFSFASLSFS
jgi:hypothetical protein